MNTEIIFSDATKLAELIRTWKRSLAGRRGVMHAHLDRIAAANPKINAIVTLAVGALNAAKGSGSTGIGRRRTRPAARRPVHGQGLASIPQAC